MPCPRGLFFFSNEIEALNHPARIFDITTINVKGKSLIGFLK